MALRLGRLRKAIIRTRNRYLLRSAALGFVKDLPGANPTPVSIDAWTDRTEGFR